MTSKHEKSPPGHGLSVTVTDDNLERAIKKLKKLIQNDGFFNDLKKYTEYEKPSVIKRRKKAEAVRRQQKALSLRRKLEGY